MTRPDGGNLNEALRQIEQLRKQLQSQGRLASLGALVAGISHEIKNPLNLIKNFTGISEDSCHEIRELLGAHKNDPSPDLTEHLNTLLDKLQFNLNKLQDQSKRASSIVDRMLHHSRDVSGDYEIVDLNALVDDYVTLAYNGVRAVEADFNVKIERRYDVNLSAVRLSQQAMGQALLNIVTNAFQAMLAKKSEQKDFAPVLKVTTKDRENAVEVSIRDNGPGIKQENLPKIFKPFFTTKLSGDGTGLGLSISYDLIVTEHKGEIAVSSREGKYTEFVLSLPKEGSDNSTGNNDPSLLSRRDLNK
jgi:signal transduction histidine kinase